MMLCHRAARVMAPKVGLLGPRPMMALLRGVVQQPIAEHGLPTGAAQTGREQLDLLGGDVSRAVADLVTIHAMYAAGHGFAANLGGRATHAESSRASVVGLALVQCQMVAAVAHVHGHDLSQQRVRDAVLACLIPPKRLRVLLAEEILPGGPEELARVPHPGDMTAVVAAEVDAALLARVTDGHLGRSVAERIELARGVIGGLENAKSTRAIGRYAAEELAKC